MCNRFALFALLVATAASGAVGQEWTRFRGPNGSGVSEAADIPVQFSETDFNWKCDLPGTGISSPVIWGKKVFVLSANPTDATRYVLGISSDDGQIAWKKEFPSKSHHLHPRNTYATSTPAVDEERVYVAWSNPDETILRAFDHEGNDVWSRDLGTWVSDHGFGTSPIVYKDLVILHNSQQGDAKPGQDGFKPGKSRMQAFDRRTGKDAWSTELVASNVCYSVPIIYQAPGADTDELICMSTSEGVFSLDPLTGKKNWSHGSFKMRTVNSPIVAGGLILGSTGSGGYKSNYAVAVRPGKQPELAYELQTGKDFKAPYVPTFIADGDTVFCFHDDNFVSCIDAKTGKTHWVTRSGFSLDSSPIRIRDKIYAVDLNGDVWVIASDKQAYRVLAKNPLGEPTRATPAVSGGRLYIRTESHLFSIGGSAKAG